MDREAPSPRPHVLVFDSGIGGMGVVQALRDTGADLHIDYLADTALFPYGEQPDDVLVGRIVTLVRNACDALNPDLLVIACNTASTIALPALRDVLPIPVVGCVPPIRWAGRVSTSRVIGLLSTSATARRPYILDLHQRFAGDCHLVTHGARALADLAERAFLGESVADTDVRAELDQLFSRPSGDKIDTIGLGCTHYTFLMPAFTRVSERPVTWLDPAPAVARQALIVLNEHPVGRQPSAPPRMLMTSGPSNPAQFTAAIQRLGYGYFEIFQPVSLPAPCG